MIRQIMLLLATRIDDGARRLGAIQRHGPWMRVCAQSVGHSANLVVRCGRGLSCNSRRILGEDVEGVSRSERSRDRVVCQNSAEPKNV